MWGKGTIDIFHIQLSSRSWLIYHPLPHLSPESNWLQGKLPPYFTCFTYNIHIYIHIEYTLRHLLQKTYLLHESLTCYHLSLKTCHLHGSLTCHWRLVILLVCPPSSRLAYVGLILLVSYLTCIFISHLQPCHLISSTFKENPLTQTIQERLSPQYQPSPSQVSGAMKPATIARDISHTASVPATTWNTPTRICTVLGTYFLL